MYDFKYLGSAVNFLRVIEKVVILWTVPLNYQLILRMIAIESMHSLSNLKYVGIFDYLEGIVRIQKIYARISKRYLQIMKLWCKTTSVFSKNNFSHSSSISTGLTGHKRFEIWAFILAIITYHYYLLGLGRAGWDFSAHGWFMGLSLARPSSGEQSIMITVSANQSFCYKFEIQ